ncbi:MAG: Gfo/Idh/MocA family protein [Candidatus Binatia bacterium]
MRARRDGAIIGFGNVAAQGHVPGWRARRDFRIVAVADTDPQRRTLAQRLLPGVRTYASGAALLHAERLDFVDIATPPALHAPAIVAAARAGLHVLCEKPLTTSLADYEAVRAAVRESGVVLHTVHNWKYSEGFRAARRCVAGGTLGRLKRISFDTARNGFAAGSADWRVRASLAGGGILVDHGWHAFYLLLALAAEPPRRISATLERRRYADAEVEDTARCTIDFPSLDAEIRLTWAARTRRTRWCMVGADGRLTIDDDRLVMQGKGAPQGQRLATALSHGSHHPEWFAGVLEAFQQELDEPSARGANQAEAEWCLLMLNLAYASGARDARPLDIPDRRVWFNGGCGRV